MADSNPEGTVTAEESALRQLGLLDSDESNQEFEPEETDSFEEEAGFVDEEGSDEDDDASLESADDGQDDEINAEEAEADRMRLADYTRKTQELAREREQIQATLQQELQAVQQERQLYAQYLGQLANANVPQKPDLEAIAKEQGMEAAFAAKIQYDNQVEQYNALTAEQQQAHQRLMQDQARSKQEWQEQELTALMNARPEWKDENAYKQAATEIESFALEFGYTQDQLAEVSHRDILVLDAARKWFAANEKAQNLKPVQGKVSRPGAKGQMQGKSRARKTQERYKKTGSVEDAAADLRRILG